MEATTDLFISVIQNNPIIYDNTSNDFKCSLKKEKAWVKIAKDTRMTVNDAKKRYVSLRAKYSRQKKKVELSKRSGNAVKSSREWVFFERLQFLDHFISPRRTHTNDTFFLIGDANSEDQGKTCETDCGVQFDANGESHTKENQNEDELGYTSNDSYESDFVPERNVAFRPQIPEDFVPIRSTTYAPLADSPQHSSQEQEMPLIRTAEFISDYSGQVITTMHFADESDPEFQSTNPLSQSQSNDCPTTSAECLSTPGACPATSNTNQPTSHPSRKVSPAPVPAQTTNVSASATVVAAGGIVPAQARVVLGNASTSQTNISRGRGLPNTVGKSSNTDKSQAPSADILRKKMDSYLNQCSDKLSEKPQRSPHAPFLSYLGTKLESVAKEKIQEVEVKLLNVVLEFLEEN